MRRLALWILVGGLSAAASAEKKTFHDKQWGLMAGDGYILPQFSNHVYNPAPDLAPSGTSVTGTDKSLMMPLKFGFFIDLPARMSIDLYGINVRNKVVAWTAGSDSGTTKWNSVGAGASLGVAFARWELVQLQAVAMGEYIQQKALLKTGTQKLNIATTSMFVGGGIRAEFAVLDLWTIGLYGGYLYGMASEWKATQDGRLMGVAHAEGALTNADGDKLMAKYMGSYLEASFRLSFY